MTRAIRWAGVVACLAALIGPASFASAQTYPDKPVRLVLPYAPGGIVDFIGRTLGQRLSEELGQPFVAENKPGAGGILGTDVVAQAAPDGYTLLLMDPAIIINPTLQENVPYDFKKDLKVVSVISSSPLVLVTSPALPAKTFAEFLAYAKANPGKLNYGSAGIGTTPHLAGELFSARAGAKAMHIPYRGIAAAFPDMMANKVQFAFSSITGAKPFTNDNRVRALATTGTKPSSAYPDLPTVAAAGLEGFDVDLWLAVFVPAATPEPIVAKLNKAVAAAIADAKTVEAFAKVGVEPRGTTPAEGNAIVAAEFEKWRKVIKDGGIKQP
ncbi:Bug family tripartite tricarboxylate transporter substrate binding protein [Rhodoplanes roseus]|uniref:ABC transporter substrate-binding protein n=1 Tax=Rhodoplanes roseus TaxID=29409 RepID=A0A327L117_9BRAD|nr:tripartite tricarboxylate transporter substrate binding protein [Rhodoplanes roseus]RAI44141.1 hypothetical protein CH341_10655 [Rhodoplanes roseus]